MDQATAPAIILVHPQMGENIGATARAMANFGLTDLYLVAPRDGWPNKAAEANAVGAFEQLSPIQIFDTTKKALESFHTVYATTARPRDMRKPVMTPQNAIAEMRAQQQANQKTAIMFGGERAGLTNEDISHAHNIITFPTNPDFSSLNLGQSVLLLAYQWFSSADKTEDKVLPTGDSAPAEHKEISDLVDRLENELLQHNFFRNEDMQPTMMRNIRSMLARTDMTEQEVRTFHGIISALIGNKSK